MSRGLGRVQSELMHALAARASPGLRGHWFPGDLYSVDVVNQGTYSWITADLTYPPQAEYEASAAQWSAARRAIHALEDRGWVETGHAKVDDDPGQYPNYSRLWWRPKSGMPEDYSGELAPEFDTLAARLLNDNLRFNDGETTYLIRGIERENDREWRLKFLQHIANSGALVELQRRDDQVLGIPDWQVR